MERMGWRPRPTWLPRTLWRSHAILDQLARHDGLASQPQCVERDGTVHRLRVNAGAYSAAVGSQWRRGRDVDGVTANRGEQPERVAGGVGATYDCSTSSSRWTPFRSFRHVRHFCLASPHVRTVAPDALRVAAPPSLHAARAHAKRAACTRWAADRPLHARSGDERSVCHQPGRCGTRRAAGVDAQRTRLAQCVGGRRAGVHRERASVARRSIWT